MYLIWFMKDGQRIEKREDCFYKVARFVAQCQKEGVDVRWRKEK